MKQHPLETAKSGARVRYTAALPVDHPGDRPLLGTLLQRRGGTVWEVRWDNGIENDNDRANMELVTAHPAAEAAREIGKAFEGLALAFERGYEEDESVICLAVACDEFFAAYRETVGKGV